MVLTVLGAVSRNFIRGILSFHIVSQFGYMILAIGFFTPLTIAACIFYVIHHIIVKSSLFLIGGMAISLNQLPTRLMADRRREGSRTSRMRQPLERDFSYKFPLRGSPQDVLRQRAGHTQSTCEVGLSRPGRSPDSASNPGASQADVQRI